MIGSVHIGAESPYKATNVASFVAGRSLPEIVAPYFDEIIGAARSGLFDTIGHLDFVKRYLVPHVLPAQPRRPRSGTSRSLPRSSNRARPSRSTPLASASCPVRPTRPRRSSPATESWGAGM